jgi:hypothetical protein
VTRQPTWREVADLLGERLRHQAHQCPIADAEGTQPVFEGGNMVGVIRGEDRIDHDRSACPFCCDTDAYAAYRRRVAGS